MALRDHARLKSFQGFGFSGSRYLLSLFAIRENFCHAFLHAAVAMWIKEPSCLIVFNQVGNTADVGRRHRKAGCHGFEHNHGAVIFERRKHEEGAARYKSLERVPVSESFVTTPRSRFEQCEKFLPVSGRPVSQSEKQNLERLAGGEGIERADKG